MAKSPKRSSQRSKGSRRPTPPKHASTKLRIVSGEFRGRKVTYHGDPATRPMKERTREAVFSLLGGKLADTCTLDLFGGTGVLALEAVSRGSQAAIILEFMHKAVNIIVDNLEELGLKDRIRVQNVDTLRWLKNFSATDLARALPDCDWSKPWIVFVCPPYRLWTAESEKLTSGLSLLMESCPAGSRIVCETDKSFDVTQALPDWEWDARFYDPATIAITRT